MPNVCLFNQTQILMILFLFSGLTISAQKSHSKNFRHLTAIEGLSHNTVFDIAQDNDGFIWIATGEGLDRYDSYNFKNYYSGDSETSIPSNEVLSLLICNTGKLFVGTANGLCLFNPEYDNFTQIKLDNQSLGRISDIYETSEGKIIVSTPIGVFYLSSEGEIQSKLPITYSINSIQEDSSGNLWAHRSQGLFCFDKNGKTLKTFDVKQEGLPHFIPSPISALMIDSKDRIWLGTFRDGPIILDAEENKFRSIPLKTPSEDMPPIYFARDIKETPDGKLWFGTENGLFIYDPEEKEYEHYRQSFDPSDHSINDNAIYRIFRSRENIMWLGTYFGGLNIWKPSPPGFKTIKPGIKQTDLKGKAIGQIIKGPDNSLWIATEDAGVAIYDQEKESFKHIFNIPQQGNRKINSNVHALTVGADGCVWSGNFLGGVNKIDPKNFSIQNYIHIPGNPKSLIQNFVFSLYTDPSDILWVGTMVGIDCFDKKKTEFTRFKPEIFRGKHIYDIFQDNQKNYWFCTYNKQGVYRYNQKKDEVTHFMKDSTPGINENSFISHCIDTRGKIWFGTRGGGLVFFDPDTEKFTTYDMNDGLPNNIIYGILEDDHNNLWLSSNKGISRFNYLTKEIRNFTVDHGLVGNQFNYKSYMKTADGTMYFGAVNGLTYFHPDKIQTIESKPIVHFTDFKLFNQTVLPGEKSVLKNDIDRTSEITLKYNQNVISFDFIALDMYSNGKSNFFYYMDGFESTWQSAGQKQSVSYTNLPPGEYHFKIKATNYFNIPNNLERNIKLTILPPIWKTNLAYFIYFVLLCGLVFILYRNSEIRHREKMALKIEKIEKEKLNELHQHKLNFFTYISHEFKTPLTIILATLDALFPDDNISANLKNKILTLKRNAFRLQLLINQLMDFRKIETDHTEPNLQLGNVVQYLQEIFHAFCPLFHQKNIEYHFETTSNSLYSWFDPDKLEKIVSNLLSNAFKYTPPDGVITFRVSLEIEEDTSWLRFSVSDTGTGINKDKLNKIFNLFYKINKGQNEYQGSGVGLTLTQSLVKYLKGNITADSIPGIGSTFTVQLPFIEAKQPKDTPKPLDFNRDIINDLISQSFKQEDEPVSNMTPKEFDILFVEDNKELLKFLHQHFRTKYAVTSTPNGLAALESIKKNIPDLIVTDLMMPEMNGIALCKKLKSNFEYCHIPIIMLTSKSDIETRLESLEVGADYYLPKPFNLPELELHIRNILSAKTNLKKHFIHFGNLNIEHPIKNRDQQFIEKITLLIQEEMSNPEFSVANLTAKLGIGRTLLHTKLKQIMDMSATEFINTIRLTEAKKLLIEYPELTMAEVAYKIGFNDPNYFSRTFKKVFGTTPSNFRIHNLSSPTN